MKETFESKQEMDLALISSLFQHMLYRRRSGQRKEPNVNTPLHAIEKWVGLKPKMFNKTAVEFKNEIVSLKQTKRSGFQKQPIET